MSQHHIGHAAKHGIELVRELVPLDEHKNPAAAFGAGMVLGALGVAIYLKSAKDFFICLGMFIVLTTLMPFGPGEAVGWLFAPIYGAWRAHTSNEKLSF